MQGSMCQRGDAWHLRVFAGRDSVTGRKRWIAKTVHGGKRVAQRELANLIAEVDRGLATGTEATVNDLIVRWIELASPDWSPSTLVQTRSAIRTHMDLLLHGIGAADVESPIRVDDALKADPETGSRWCSPTRRSAGSRPWP